MGNIAHSFIDLFGTVNVLLNYKKFQTKIDQMLEEWEVIATLRLDFCFLVDKINI